MESRPIVDPYRDHAYYISIGEIIDCIFSMIVIHEKVHRLRSSTFTNKPLVVEKTKCNYCANW